MTKPRKMEAPVVIVGGGIVGGATAYYLARRGVQPLVLERSAIGVEASARSADGVRAQCRDRLERILAMASIRLWEGLEAELAFDMEYVQGGNIRLAANEERMAQLATEAEEELADAMGLTKVQALLRENYVGSGGVTGPITNGSNQPGGNAAASGSPEPRPRCPACCVRSAFPRTGWPRGTSTRPDR